MHLYFLDAMNPVARERQDEPASLQFYKYLPYVKMLISLNFNMHFIMKKLIFSFALIFLVSFLAGCNGKPETKKETTINPLSPSSMVDTYQDSKGKINDSVQKQNETTTKALEDSEINE